MALTRGIFIVGAKRTPFGTFGGVLKDKTGTDLAEVAAKAALAAGNINPEIIDTTVIGNVAQTSPDAAYTARHVALRCGVPVSKPALTVNRLCGSGFTSIVTATQEILAGDAEVALTGGTENMSMAPYTLRGARFGTKLGEDQKPIRQGSLAFELAPSSFATKKGPKSVTTGQNLPSGDHHLGSARKVTARFFKRSEVSAGMPQRRQSSRCWFSVYRLADKVSLSS
nr:3-ketoacyl-CoA thiolase, mitochondrial-like [Lytechinus pictus]